MDGAYTGQGIPIPRVITNGRPPADLDMAVFNPEPFEDSE
jgi:hypothetical protein